MADAYQSLARGDASGTHAGNQPLAIFQILRFIIHIFSGLLKDIAKGLAHLAIVEVALGVDLEPLVFERTGHSPLAIAKEHTTPVHINIAIPVYK